MIETGGGVQRMTVCEIFDGFDIFEFELGDDDKAAIAALDDGTRVIDPGWAPAWDGS